MRSKTFADKNVDKFVTVSFLQTTGNVTTEDLFVCVQVLRPNQPNGVMSSADSLPNHTFTRQA